VSKIDFAAIDGWADCALVDLGLGDSQGLETVKRVVSAAPRVPVVVVSGLNDRMLALSAIYAGAQDYLGKDRINAEVLVVAIHYAIERTRKNELSSPRSRAAHGRAPSLDQVRPVDVGYASFGSENTSGLTYAGIGLTSEAGRAEDQIPQPLSAAMSRTQGLPPIAEGTIESAELVNLIEGLEEAGPRPSDHVGHAIKWGVNGAADPPAALGSRAYLQQVLVNLAESARVTLGDGSRLTINVDELSITGQENQPAGACFRLRLNRMRSGTLGESFEDGFNGLSLANDTDAAVGRGLAVLYAIMPPSDRGVEGKWEPGLGTSVTMRFPTLDSPSRGSASTDEAHRQEERVILVVDDEPAVRTLVTRILEQGGYSVISAASGADALEAVQDHPGEIELLLADVIMPKMLGTELAMRMTDAHPEIPVVLMSGYTAQDLQSEGTLNTDHALLEKPFEFHELLAAVRSAIDIRSSGTGTRPTAAPA
jgi:DNA-binding response OmpR family regulator